MKKQEPNAFLLVPKEIINQILIFVVKDHECFMGNLLTVKQVNKQFLELGSNILNRHPLKNSKEGSYIDYLFPFSAAEKNVLKITEDEWHDMYLPKILNDKISNFFKNERHVALFKLISDILEKQSNIIEMNKRLGTTITNEYSSKIQIKSLLLASEFKQAMQVFVISEFFGDINISYETSLNTDLMSFVVSFE